MNSLGARTLILLAAVGVAFLFFASPLGDRLAGWNKTTVSENPVKPEEKRKTPLPVLRLKRDVLKAPPPPVADEPHLPAPKTAGSKAGALTNNEIEDAVGGRQSLFQRCWTQRLRDTPGLTGRTLLQFEITPRGKVQEVQVVESTLNDDLMLRCLVSVLERISFREFDGGSVTLTFPLSFE
jgi:outer membrane biosynthesis protein TonB